MGKGVNYYIELKYMSYQRKVEQHENDQLTYYTQRANVEQEQEETGKLFVNLSVKQIIQGLAQTIIDIVNDLVSGEIKDAKGLVAIFFYGDRMIYLGVLLVLVAFSVYLIDITS